MGRTTNTSPTDDDHSKCATKINHFSHPHSLQLTNPTQLQNFQPQSTCSACKLEVSGSTFYICKPCNFILHIKCSQLPQEITHPFHKNHVFNLLPKPIYPDGCFSCDACGNKGDGFSYHCKACNFDLHILCSLMPLSITHHWSHPHQLKLAFSPPYPKKCFSCDICKNPGGNHWLYRCDSCRFDAHLSCTKLRSPPQQVNNMQQINQTTFMGYPAQAPNPQVQTFYSGSRSSPHQPQGFGFNNFGQNPPFIRPQVNMNPMLNLNPAMINPAGIQAPGFNLANNRQYSDLVILRELFRNHNFMQMLMSGGNGGGPLQGLIQAMNGGGNIPGLDGFGGLGGGGQGVLNFLQTLSGGGGGGGLNGVDIFGGDGGLSAILNNMGGFDLGGLGNLLGAGFSC